MTTLAEHVKTLKGPDPDGFGSIIGRNSFQRKRPEALKFLETIMGIYAGTRK